MERTPVIDLKKIARISATAVGAAAAAAGAVTFGAWVEARAFLVYRVSVPVLEPGSAPLRVLHISDIHLVPRQRLKQRFIAGLQGLEPDLVVNTGDNISSPHAIAPLVDCLGSLLDRPGVFVLGSNDAYAPTFRNPASYLFRDSTLEEAQEQLPTDEMIDAFSSRGWVGLANEATRLEVAGRVIDVRGTRDAHLKRDNYDPLAGKTAPDADLTLGVTHAPYRRVLDAMAADDLDLILAGHTHGGQICLPVNRAIIDNCDLPTSQASGLSTWSFGKHTVALHVSGGIGTSPMAPIRLFCRPSATLLTLTARDR